MIWAILGIVEVKSGQILSFCKYYHNCLIHTVYWVIRWIVIMPIIWNIKLELCSRHVTQWMYNHAFWYVLSIFIVKYSWSYASAMSVISSILASSMGLTRNARRNRWLPFLTWPPFWTFFGLCLPDYLVTHGT